MAIRVLIAGSKGKMGTITEATLLAHPDFEVIKTCQTTADLKDAIAQESVDVAVDFTTPACVYDHCVMFIEANIHPVIGTTGLTTSQIKHLQVLSLDKKLGGIIAPNFSLSAIWLMKCAALISKSLQDVNIIEYHHPAKKDKPSGTAIRTAELIRQNTNKEVPIHAIRLPGVIANQDVIFGNESETLTLSHKTLDRKCFMPGVIKACKEVTTLDKLVYGLEQLI